MYHIIIKILHIAKIKANRTDIQVYTSQPLTLQELPDILFSWKIHSLAVELEVDDLAGIDNPMLLELRKEKESDLCFALLFKEAGAYRLCQENGRETAINLGQIPVSWPGRALAMRLPENPLESPGYRQGLIKTRFQNAYTVALAVLAGASSLFWIAAAPLSARSLVLLALYATGDGLSAILTKASFDTAFSEKTCKTVSGGKGCAGVLDSPVAKIGGWLSMGEIGLFYFASMFLVLAGALYGADGLQAVPRWLAAIALLAAFYPFFSVYYQWKIKSWCPICLAVQAVLLVAAVLSSPFLGSLELINPGMAAIEAAKLWLGEQGIDEVPAIYVDGPKLPGLYGLSSLRFYLRDLILENI